MTKEYETKLDEVKNELKENQNKNFNELKALVLNNQSKNISNQSNSQKNKTSKEYKLK